MNEIILECSCLCKSEIERTKTDGCANICVCAYMCACVCVHVCVRDSTWTQFETPVFFLFPGDRDLDRQKGEERKRERNENEVTDNSALSPSPLFSSHL